MSSIHPALYYQQLQALLPRRIVPRLLACSFGVLLLSVVADYTPFAMPHFHQLTHKRSLLNRYMIKYAWLHTSNVWLISTIPALLTSRDPIRILPSLISPYLFSTIFWFLMTQSVTNMYTSFFDSLFLRSGGGCHVDGQLQLLVLSPAMCRAQKGNWIGGHDVSGHIFLLLLALSLLLQTAYRSSVHSHLLSTPGNRHIRSMYIVSRIVLSALMAIWLLGLAITSLYYHHFLEKLNALIIVNAFYFLIYHVFNI